ncbi:MAG TPA: LPS assembly lipoprotein LptE [Thermoanaerobaculia bacterium]|nr:LPS assembly lipoprotein LptE [Thermoanaerobaculia bacterium]
MARLRPALRLAGAAFATLTLAGCGYSLVGRGSTLPADLRVIRFETLANETSRVAVEQRVSREIARELATRGRFEVRADSRDADAELFGAVTQFDLYPVAFDEQGRAREYQVAVTARVTFRTVPDEKILWENAAYTFRDNYSLPQGAAGYADRENEAIDRVAERFAASLVSSVLEGF